MFSGVQMVTGERPYLDLRVDPSLHPQVVDRTVEASIVDGFVPTLMLYRTPRQVRKWQEIVASYSPASREEDGAVAYETVHRTAAELVDGGPLQVIGLACGDGRKEASLTRILTGSGIKKVTATPVDASLPLVQIAATTLSETEAVQVSGSVMADLEVAGNSIAGVFDRDPDVRRIVTLYGVLPGISPEPALEAAASLMVPGDLLCLSANARPDPEGVDSVVAQYDNEETRTWIEMMLEDLTGVGYSGEIDIEVTSDGADGSLIIEGRVIRDAGGPLRVFRSARHGLDDLHRLSGRTGFEIELEASSPSGEELVALARLRG